MLLLHRPPDGGARLGSFDRRSKCHDSLPPCLLSCQPMMVNSRSSLRRRITITSTSRVIHHWSSFAAARSGQGVPLAVATDQPQTFSQRCRALLQVAQRLEAARQLWPPALVAEVELGTHPATHRTAAVKLVLGQDRGDSLDRGGLAQGALDLRLRSHRPWSNTRRAPLFRTFFSYTGGLGSRQFCCTA